MASVKYTDYELIAKTLFCGSMPQATAAKQYSLDYYLRYPNVLDCHCTLVSMLDLDKKMATWKLRKWGESEAHSTQKLSALNDPKKESIIATVRAIRISPPYQVTPDILSMSVVLEESGRLNYGTTNKQAPDTLMPSRAEVAKWSPTRLPIIRLLISTRLQKPGLPPAREAAHRVYNIIGGAIRDTGECIMTLRITKDYPHAVHNLRNKEYFIVHLNRESWHRSLQREEDMHNPRKKAKQRIFGEGGQLLDQQQEAEFTEAQVPALVENMLRGMPKKRADDEREDLLKRQAKLTASSS